MGKVLDFDSFRDKNAGKENPDRGLEELKRRIAEDPDRFPLGLDTPLEEIFPETRTPEIILGNADDMAGYDVWNLAHSCKESLELLLEELRKVDPNLTLEEAAKSSPNVARFLRVKIFFDQLIADGIPEPKALISEKSV
jgi:hypothetical protein